MYTIIYTSNWSGFTFFNVQITFTSGEFYTETTSKAHYGNKALSAALRPQPIIPQEIRQPPAEFNGKSHRSTVIPVMEI